MLSIMLRSLHKEQDGLDYAFCLQQIPFFSPLLQIKWVSCILSTGMAWGVTGIVFDFCKRGKKETNKQKKQGSELFFFLVNILLVSQSFSPTRQSWGLLWVLHQATTLSVCIETPSVQISGYHLNSVVRKRHVNISPGKNFTCCHLSVFTLVSFAHY